MTTIVERDIAKAERLRDLTPKEFFDRYESDRFTSTILSNRFRYVLHHVCSKLLNTAFSPVIRDFFDFAATISGPAEISYGVPAVAESVSPFFGSMRDGVAGAIKEFGPENLLAGDILIANDPFRGGTHVNDVCFLRPVFHDDRIISVVTIRAHMLDLGGVVPGGFSGLEHNVYETGLVVPPTLLYRNNEPVRSTISLLLDNIRFGSIIIPDIRTIGATLMLGEELLLESVNRYGADAYVGAMRYALDASAEGMRTAIEALPNGVYNGEGFVDCDGVDELIAYRVAAKVTKMGHRLEVDFDGSSSQARTSINGAWPDIKSEIAIALKLLIDPHNPFTSACLRDVDIVVPPRTIISAEPPDGPVFIYWEPMKAAIRAVMRALVPALGPNAVAGDSAATWTHSAYGVRESGEPWVNVGLCGAMQGGWGATKSGDADSGQWGYFANMIDPPIETIEADTPVLIMRREYVPDSAGPGLNRGGAGLVKDSLWLTDSEAHCLAVDLRTACGYGVEGGYDAPGGGIWTWTPEAVERTGGSPFLSIVGKVYSESDPVAGVLDPETSEPDLDGTYCYWLSRPSWKLAAGSIWRYLSSGGGGWGDPLERDPSRVVQDVRDGYLSVDGASVQYGVAVLGDPMSDPEGLTFDADATSSLRDHYRSDPSAIGAWRQGKINFPSVAPGQFVDRKRIAANCPECGASEVATYPVLGEDGWLEVTKCQICLASLERVERMSAILPMALSMLK